MDKSIAKYLRNNDFKQKDNEQMALLESQKKVLLETTVYQ